LFPDRVTAHKQVFPKPFDFDAGEPDGFGHPGASGPADGPRGIPAPDELWGNKSQHLINQAPLKEASKEAAAPLDQRPGNLPAAEFPKEGHKVDPTVDRRQNQNFGPPGLKGRKPFRVGQGRRRNQGRGRAVENPGLQGRPSPGVDNDPEGLAGGGLSAELLRPGGKGRVVGQDGPDPDHDGINLGPEPVDESPGGRAGHPAAVAGAGSDFPVQGHRVLGQDKRPAGGNVFKKPLVKPAGLGLVLANHDPDAPAGEGLHTPAVNQGIRVEGCDVDLGNTGLEDGVGAGRGPAVVTAGLEGNVKGGAPGELAGLGQGNPLGVRTAGRPGRPATDNLPIPDDNSPDGRVRARRAENLAGKLKGLGHKIGPHRFLPS